MIRHQDVAALHFQNLSGICCFQGTIWILALVSLDTSPALFTGAVHDLSALTGPWAGQLFFVASHSELILVPLLGVLAFQS